MALFRDEKRRQSVAEPEDVESALLRKEDVQAPARKGVTGPQRGTELGAVLGRGSRFEGKLAFEGTVRIEGHFKGDILSEGELIVGAGAVVEGTVAVDAAVISGRFAGKLTAKSRLALKGSAHVEGELHVASLTVEEGAYFDGTVKMGGPSGAGE